MKNTTDSLERLSATDGSVMPVCANCGKPATCYGAYEDQNHAYACDDCCGHGNEDGHCYPIKCPQCGESTVKPRDSEAYCEDCGWPDENRLGTPDGSEGEDL